VTDIDERLTSAFASFRNEVGPLVRPSGTGPARTTVRGRRRRRTVVLAAAAVVAVPAVAYAVLGDNTPPAVPPVAAAPSASASASASPTPSAPVHVEYDLVAGATPVTFVATTMHGYRGSASVGVRNLAKKAERYELLITFTDGLKVIDDGTCRAGSKPGTALCTGTIEALSTRMFTVGFTSPEQKGEVRILGARKVAQ
jgi:hypothetical protein